MTMEVRQDEVLGIFDAALLVVPASPPDFVGFAMLFVPREGGAVTVLRRVDRVIQISPYARFQPSKLCVGAGMPMPHYAA
jgi:hypothetical protein